jgi:two-component system, response regulator PdtaR
MAEPRKVLIVEDETLTAMMLEDRVEKLGFVSAGCCATGEEAVRRARAERPDLVLMDFRLAGRMDGMEAALLINAERETPIVIISGYSERAVLERAGDYRPRAFLSKPIDLDDVDRLLGSIG